MILLGDAIKAALETVGVTEDRVQDWLGRPCKCKDRRNKINQLDRWARDVTADAAAQAKAVIKSLMGE